MGELLHANEVELGHVVYIVEDTDTGPSRLEWCERTEKGFTGWLLGDSVMQALRVPDDGRRIEHFARSPGFRTQPTSWMYGKWLVIDTETTGLDTREDPAGIVELGAVIMHEGQVIEHRAGLFNPGKPINPMASEVHGITDAMVAKRPKITEPNPKTGRTPVQGIDALAAKHDVTCIVGYNALTFDLPIMRRELGYPWVALEDVIGLVVDPLVVVRLDGVGRFWKGKGRHRLTAVAERFGLDKPEPGMESQAHRAVWDCVLAGRILWHLREHVPLEAIGVKAMMRVESKKQQESFDAWQARQPKPEAS